MASMSSGSRTGTGRRYLSVVFPDLPIERIRRLQTGRSWRSVRPPPTPLVIVGKLNNALRLVALDRVAEGFGLRPGLPLAEARAMLPGLEVREEDAAADSALLDSLADWAERYTPLVALDAPRGLMLDITGAAHLLGGEAPLVADLVARLDEQGFWARAAVADTPGAAFAAALFSATRQVAVDGNAALLADLPLAALRLDDETVAALDRVGLKRIGQIMGAPRAPLTARFGRVLLRRLDQALGREEESINPRRPVPALVAERRFAEPVMQGEGILATLASLAESLRPSLERRGEGARAVELALFRVDGQVARLAIRTSRPVQAAGLILALFRERLAGLGENLDVGFGCDMIRLAVQETAACEAVQADLAGGLSAEADLGQLIDRIGMRLGRDRVGRLAVNDSHIPERAGCFQAGVEQEEWQTLSPVHVAGSGEPVTRPLRLFARPERIETTATVPDGPPVRFRWRGVLYRVTRSEGPERVGPEWWRAALEDGGLSRDYFRVEDDCGRRFWLFREGLYGRETAMPNWYVHGVFA